MEVQQNSCMPVCVKNNLIVVVPWGTRASCEAIIDAINNWDGEKKCTMPLELRTERAQNEIEALGMPRKRGQNLKKITNKKIHSQQLPVFERFFHSQCYHGPEMFEHDQHVMLTR